jgi:hypothetical protein
MQRRRVTEAQKIFDFVICIGLHPDVIMYNSLKDGYRLYSLIILRSSVHLNLAHIVLSIFTVRLRSNSNIQPEP